MDSLVSKTNQHHPRLVDREHFRSVMGHFASGVTIISTRHEGIDYGLTASGGQHAASLWRDMQWEDAV